SPDELSLRAMIILLGQRGPPGCVVYPWPVRENLRSSRRAPCKFASVATRYIRVNLLRRPIVGGRKVMGLILLVLLIALLLGGLGFASHVLWLVAAVVFIGWLLGFGLRSGEGRWYRW